MARSKDLFDDTTMTFGEHLDVLRTHLIKALLGLVVAVACTLTWGNHLVNLIRTPIDDALKRNAMFDEKDDVSGFNFWGHVKGWFGSSSSAETAPPVKKEQPPAPTDDRTIVVRIKPSELLSALHQADPQHFKSPSTAQNEETIALPLAAPEFRVFRQTTEEMHRTVALNVQEAFMMYLKVAFVAAIIFAAPWILYQAWQFVAAGLYSHERKYVYVYMPMSVGLFLFGAFFAFYIALPLVLDFLLSYNRWLQVKPEIRLSEWVSFVILLPLMFGVSFQLPLVMLFLERIGIFNVSVYRMRRRLAIFIIAVLAMLLSPGGDPGTMMVMFAPLILLYELGILLCARWKNTSPLEEPVMT